MSIEKLVIVAMVIASATPMPSNPRPDKMDVTDVINKTVCPIRLQIDEDDNRIPRRIRVMECAKNVNKWCAKNKVPPQDCCQHQHEKVLMHCVEVQDMVQVFYPATNVTQTMRVSVGCMCVMDEKIEAVESSPS